MRHHGKQKEDEEKAGSFKGILEYFVKSLSWSQAVPVKTKKAASKRT